MVPLVWGQEGSQEVALLLGQSCMPVLCVPLRAWYYSKTATLRTRSWC
jgi:hypothetical protein